MRAEHSCRGAADAGRGPLARPGNYGASSARVAAHTLPIPDYLARFQCRIAKSLVYLLAKLPASYTASSRRLETVTVAADRFEQRLPPRRVDLAPQPRDIN